MKMKRVTALALSMVMAAGILAGCAGKQTGSTTQETIKAESQAGSQAESQTEGGDSAAAGTYNHQTDHEKFKIGVCFGEMSNENLERMDYLKNYIAPYYNVDFVFSEALQSAEAEINFIENAQVSGAVGILSFLPTNWEQVGFKCEELGLYYVVQRTAGTNSIDELPYMMGGFGTKQESNAEQMGIAARKFLSDGESHGILIPTLQACKNNVAHRLNSTAVLEAVQDAYGLTFTKSIDELVISGEPTSAENDKGIEVYLYPGMLNDESVITGISAALLTGKYDIVMGAGNTYTQLSQVIDEAERAFNKNIMVSSVGELSESLHIAMNTDDCTGNKALDFAVVKSTTVITGTGFSMMMNALLGDGDVLKPEGKAMKFQGLNWGCDGPDELAVIEQMDQDEDTYVFSYDVIDSLIKKTNPELTNEGIHTYLNGLTLEQCLENLGFDK